MEAYQNELKDVKDELAEVEEQLSKLLDRQSNLLKKQTQLEGLLKNASNQADTNKKWDGTAFPWSSKLTDTLQSVFRMSKLRPMQLQTMNLTLSGKDCILIMPTGGGKSLCFQLPALLSDGVTLVVSPLVSLMEDQVISLKSYGVNAAMLNASTNKDTIKQVQEAMVDKNADMKLLYVTPEKLAKSKRFMARLEKMYKVGMFVRLVIDEVHCCSQWGHDFRPDYKFLGIMKRQFPGVPILGLTATATTTVLEDVKKILNIEHCHLFRSSFNRPNLYYEVREKPNTHKEVMDDIQTLISTKFHQQSGIIYTFSKKDSEEVTAELQGRGVKVAFYHADMSAGERSRVHRAWLENSINVVVATVAFGMGIDKPDVRFVIHHSLSKSMENLYQESGRAGRDDKKSHCIVYYRLQDVFRQSAMVMTEQTGLTNLYGIVSYCVDEKKCRRSMIARYFGEVWEASQCNKMCDHCNSSYESEKKDITEYCSSVMKILDNADSSDSKLTAIKVLDAWQGKGPGANRVKGTDTAADRGKLETILAHMLIKQYIREDFHFTPYATISYLVPGPKAALLRDAKEKVFMDVQVKKKGASVEGRGTSNTKGNSSSLTSQQSTHSSGKSELVIVNRQKSAFTNKVFSSESTGDQGADHSRGKEKEVKDKVKKGTSVETASKRKRNVISDDESEELDFLDSSPKKKNR
ncbi:ATP-dependent DNA helicase Q1-like isoform X3 [Dreissena polymorpha]|uniref:ATP-dependent DNA helicase Q1-like isoform X2 n=1 Tax=Dreissena polymorpha TaxID=45954 RepID=UPI002264A794|nr:ATP-dependent DNA helicase Q1-like isoform X2 [Dreissena polymorpha]XP_052270272.1 ATP-dependent DNA helicase Q1-like isoform X3 [Dreissena polymorpha]